MLPDVRLMIAAPFASILALGCGFGMFATLHVSQEPLHRMPSAPTQLVAMNVEAPVTSIAAAAPFDDRSQISKSGGISALAYSAPEPGEPPTNDTPAAAASEHEASEAAATAAPESEPAATTLPTEVSTAESETKPGGMSGAETAPSAPTVAALESTAAEPANVTAAPAAPEQSQPQAQTVRAEPSPPEPAMALPTAALEATSEPTAKSTNKEIRETKEKESKEGKKTRIAGRTPHIHAAHLTKGDAAFELPDFRAPGNWPTETAENVSAPAKHRRAAAVLTSPDAANGIGGPFVGAPR